MRLLVVDPNRIERETTLRLISNEVCETKVALDAAEALRLLESETFDVVLVEATMTGMTGNELVKRVRDKETTSHLYIIVTASRPTSGDLKTAFALGADDFIRKPLNREELAARVDGPNRVRRWAPLVVNGFCATEPAPRPPVTSTAAWDAMEENFCATVSSMLGVQLAPAPADNPLDTAAVVAELPLSLAVDRAELRVAAGLDAESAALLAEAMYGEPVGHAALQDMVNEIANVAGGAFKRSASTEGLAFTTHVPVVPVPGELRSPTALARRHFVAACDGVTVRFEVELRTQEPKLVRVAALREGMVIVADLHNPRGALLMRSGTRITESQLAGLVSTLGPDMCIDVLDAA